MNKTSFSDLSGSVIQRTKRLFQTLFTLRGWLLLICVAYLLIVVVPEESDIVAAVFGYSALGLFLFALLITIVQGRSIKRTLRISLGAESQSNEHTFGSVLRSGEASVLLMRTNTLRIFPLFSLELQLSFEQPGVIPARHIIIGRSEEPRVLVENVTFPHRGEWLIKTLRCRFGDYLGLFCFEWHLSGVELQGSFRVHPPYHHSSSLPVLSSSVKSGDTLIDMHERRGDPFDLKPYHPSDGLRKILWKLYAKRGELISRHPEKAMTPEGKVVIFVCAGKYDEELCGHILAYLRTLEDLDIEVYFGCEGMGHEVLARSASEAEDLLIDTVWNTGQPITQSVLLELEYVLGVLQASSLESQLQSLVLFCAEQRFTESAVSDLMVRVGSVLSQKNIRPIFCVGQGVNEHSSELSVLPFGNRIWSLIVYPRPESVSYDPRYYREFAHTCASKGWEVLHVQ